MFIDLCVLTIVCDNAKIIKVNHLRDCKTVCDNIWLRQCGTTPRNRVLALELYLSISIFSPFLWNTNTLIVDLIPYKLFKLLISKCVE